MYRFYCTYYYYCYHCYYSYDYCYHCHDPFYELLSLFLLFIVIFVIITTIIVTSIITISIIDVIDIYIHILQYIYTYTYRLFDLSGLTERPHCEWWSGLGESSRKRCISDLWIVGTCPATSQSLIFSHLISEYQREHITIHLWWARKSELPISIGLFLSHLALLFETHLGFEPFVIGLVWGNICIHLQAYRHTPYLTIIFHGILHVTC